MTKQISFARIAPYKTEFDLHHASSVNSTDTDKVRKSVERMTLLQDTITKAMETAPRNISRLFNWGQQDITVDAQAISDDVQIKLSEMHSHLQELLSKTTSSSSLQGKVDPINPTPSNPSSTQSSKTAQDLATGFSNMSANCWANSFLQMIVCVPNLKQAYLTVGNYYAQKNVYDPDKIHGQALLNALTEYDNALRTKTPVPKEVTQNVRLAFNHFFGHVNPLTRTEIFSKNSWAHEDAYEAMQVLMGRYEQIIREQNPNNPQFVPLYCQMQTSRQYRPTGGQRDADQSRVMRDDYSKLGADNSSRLTCNDYQILLDLQNNGHLSFPALLSNYFRNTTVHGSDQCEYLLNNGKVQSFKLTSEGRKFLTVPNEFILTIKRFGADLRGQSYKITNPVMIPRTMALPSEATSQNKPIAYELDAFVVHSGGTGGGHYICYKKIDGAWIEANDGAVRFVDTNEIDQILHGQRGSMFTSYMHHYSRVPESAQSIALASVQNTPIPPTTPTPLLIEADIEKYSTQTGNCKNSLKALESLSSSIQSTDYALLHGLAMKELSSEALGSLRHAIWLNDNTPNVYDYGTEQLDKHPKRLQEITLPWLIGPKGTPLLNQMIEVQKKKLAIADEKLKEAHVKAFLAKLNDSSVSNEQLMLALKALPQEIQWELHGLIYHAHKIQFGEAYVHKKEYQNAYGRIALETAANLRETLKQAQESVLNTFGNNIVEQLALDHQIKAEKLQYRFEKEQLQAFRELLLHYPSHELTNVQLAKAFERFEIREELKEMLRWAIWVGHDRKSVHNYGGMKLNEDPRCILAIRAPILADPLQSPTGSNILDQLIALLDRQSK